MKNNPLYNRGPDKGPFVMGRGVHAPLRVNHVSIENAPPQREDSLGSEKSGAALNRSTHSVPWLGDITRREANILYLAVSLSPRSPETGSPGSPRESWEGPPSSRDLEGKYPEAQAHSAEPNTPPAGRRLDQATWAGPDPDDGDGWVVMGHELSPAPTPLVLSALPLAPPSSLTYTTRSIASTDSSQQQRDAPASDASASTLASPSTCAGGSPVVPDVTSGARSTSGTSPAAWHLTCGATEEEPYDAWGSDPPRSACNSAVGGDRGGANSRVGASAQASPHSFAESSRAPSDGAVRSRAQVWEAAVQPPQPSGSGMGDDAASSVDRAATREGWTTGVGQCAASGENGKIGENGERISPTSAVATLRKCYELARAERIAEPASARGAGKVIRTSLCLSPTAVEETREEA